MDEETKVFKEFVASYESLLAEVRGFYAAYGRDPRPLKRCDQFLAALKEEAADGEGNVDPSPL